MASQQNNSIINLDEDSNNSIIKIKSKMTWDEVNANFNRDLDNMSPSTRWIRLQHPYAHNGIPLVYNGTIPDDDNFQEQDDSFYARRRLRNKESENSTPRKRQREEDSEDEYSDYEEQECFHDRMARHYQEDREREDRLKIAALNDQQFEFSPSLPDYLTTWCDWCDWHVCNCNAITQQYRQQEQMEAKSPYRCLECDHYPCECQDCNQFA